MKLSPFPRGSLAAGVNTITARLENPFSYVPSGSLASGLDCQSRQTLCPRKNGFCGKTGTLVRGGKGDLFPREWSWSRVSAPSRGVLTAVCGVGSIMGQAGPVLLEVKSPCCSGVKPPGDSTERSLWVFMLFSRGECWFQRSV